MLERSLLTHPKKQQYVPWPLEWYVLQPLKVMMRNNISGHEKAPMKYCYVRKVMKLCEGVPYLKLKVEMHTLKHRCGSSSQDGGIGRHASPPPATTERITTKPQNK